MFAHCLLQVKEDKTMPKPKKGEKKREYIARCIPVVLREGTAKSREQAVAICNSLWEKHREGGGAMRD